MLLLYTPCRYDDEQQALVYPTVETMISYAKEKMQNEEENEELPKSQIKLQEFQNKILESDSLYEMHEQVRFTYFLCFTNHK